MKKNYNKYLGCEYRNALKDLRALGRALESLDVKNDVLRDRLHDVFCDFRDDIAKTFGVPVGCVCSDAVFVDSPNAKYNSRLTPPTIKPTICTF